MMIRTVTTLFLLAFALIISSCGGKKKLIYFQNGDGEITSIDHYFSPRFEVGDIITVEITSTDAEVAAPFNQPELIRQNNYVGTYSNGVPATYGYLVAPDSTITLPIIGKIKVAGLERHEAIAAIEKIVDEYLEKPQVIIRLLNFKITVLGEVNVAGTYSIPNEKVTILEAIGIANDLKITGNRKNILVIRHEDGMKKEYRVDLTSKDIFTSPVYYLKQNDVVYVEPNAKARYDASLLRSTGGVIISATSLIISTMVIIMNTK